MTSKSKTPSKSTTKAEPKEADPKYSYEFLEMLSETAFTTLIAYLKKTKAPKNVIELLDTAWVLTAEAEHLVGGGTQTNDSLPEYVADAVQNISALGGEWRAPSGIVTPLKELRAFQAKGK